MAKNNDRGTNDAKNSGSERVPSAKASSASAKPRRRWLKWLLIIVVFLGVLVALGPMIASGVGKGPIFNAVSNQLNGSATAESFDIGWFSDAKVEGLRVQHDSAAKPNVEVKSIAMSDSGIFGFLKGGPIKSQIVLNGVTVRGTKRGGKLDLADLMKPSEEKAPSDLADLDLTVVVKDLSFIYSDDELGGVSKVEHFDEITANFVTGEPLVINLNHAGLEGKATVGLFKGKRIREPDAIDATASFQWENADLKSFEQLAGPWLSSLSGKVSGRQEIVWKDGRASVAGDFGVASLRAAMKDGSAVHQVGKFSFKGDVKSTEAAWYSGEADVLVEGIEVSGLPKLKKAIEITKAHARVAFLPGKKLTWDGLSAQGPGFNIKGDGNADLSGDLPQSAGTLTTVGDVAWMTSLVEGLPDISGSLNSSVSYRLAADGKITIDGSSVIRDFVAENLPGGAPSIREKAITIDHNFDFGDGLLVARKAGIKSSFLTSNLSGSLQPGSDGKGVKGEVNMDGNADLTRIAALLGDMVPIQPSGRLRFLANVKGTGSGFQISSRLNGEQLQLSGGALKGKPLVLGAPTVVANGTMASDGSFFDFPRISFKSPLLTGVVALARKAGADGTMELSAKGHASGEVDQLAASALEKPLDFTVGKADTNFDIRFAGDKLSLQQVGIKASVANAVIKGELMLREAVGPEGVLNIDANGSLAQLIALSGKTDLPVSASGRASLKGNARLGDAMGFEGTFAAQNLVLAGQSIGAQPLRLGQLSGNTSLSLNPTQGTLNLTSFAMKCDPFSAKLSQPMSVTGFGVAGGVMNFKAAFDGRADLAKLPGTLLRLPPDARIMGATNFKGDMSWVNGQASGTINVGAEGFQLQRPNVAVVQGAWLASATAKAGGAFSASVDGRNLKITLPNQGGPKALPLQVSLAGTQSADVLALSSLSVSGSGLDIKGSGQWSEKVSSRLNLNGSANLNELSRTWLPLFSDSLRGEGVAQLNVDMTTPAASKEGMKAATGAFNATLPRLQMTGMDLSNLVVKGGITGGVAKISKGTASLNEGTVGLGGQLDMKSLPWQWNGNVDAKNVKIKEEMRPAIARVIPIFAGLGVTVTATTSGQMGVRGTGDTVELAKQSLTGNGGLSLSSGQLVGGPILTALAGMAGLPTTMSFNGFETLFKVVDGKVVQDGFTMSSNYADIRMSGTTSLEGALAWDLGLKVKAINSPQWQRWSQALGSDGFLPVRLLGTLDAPALRPPDIGSLLEKKAGSIINQGLGELLGGKKDGAQAPGEKKPANPVDILKGGLGGLLGGKPKPKQDPKKKNN